MHGTESDLTAVSYALRLAATAFFVVANGFFVAAEFALVKVRAAELKSAAAAGDARAVLATRIHRNLELYLSACQLGITLASLILGWLAEPAIAQLLIAGLGAVGVDVSPDQRLLHIVALAIALTLITVFHMTIGEQAPKIWAINRSLATTLRVVRPLQVFATILRPFIWVVNEISNWMLRFAGLSASEVEESSHNVEELRSILLASAEAGHISGRQVELAQNVLGLMALEVRHIMVPRVEAVYLSERNSLEQNLRIVAESGHSRLPLCRDGLDTVFGLVHAKDVMKVLIAGQKPDLQALARDALSVPDTQPLSSLISQMQHQRGHCAVALDEHGTAVGLVFLEDALEEIVGPLGDEFDRTPETSAPAIVRRPDGVVEIAGEVSLPDAATALGLGQLEEEADTIGGLVVARLGRLPQRGDEVRIGSYLAIVREVSRKRVDRLLFEPVE